MVPEHRQPHIGCNPYEKQWPQAAWPCWHFPCAGSQGETVLSAPTSPPCRELCVVAHAPAPVGQLTADGRHLFEGQPAGGGALPERNLQMPVRKGARPRCGFAPPTHAKLRLLEQEAGGSLPGQDARLPQLGPVPVFTPGALAFSCLEGAPCGHCSVGALGSPSWGGQAVWRGLDFLTLSLLSPFLGLLYLVLQLPQHEVSA